MARLYISSTYRDLQAERRAVSDAILRAGHQPVGMENQTADERPPLEKCVGDVGTCQAYVGIFAWRYGFSPKGHDSSITELEYREAGRLKLPRLIFLLRESAAWPTDRVDPDRARIQRLRKELCGAHTVQWFATADELEAEVTVALYERLGRGRPVPDLLPFTPDRGDQQIALEDALIAHRARAHRPLLCIFHGDEFQSQDTFLRRLEVLALPRMLELGPEQKLLSHELPLPREFRSEDDLHHKLQITLAQNVARPGASLEEIAGRIDDHPSPVMFHTHLLTHDWLRRGTPIPTYLSFWRRFPPLARQRLFVFLSVKYQTGRVAGMLNYFRRRRVAAANERMCAEIGALDLDAETELHGVRLPLLDCVSRSEAESWARSDFAQHYCGGEDLMREIRRIFEDEAAQATEACLPMEELADRLKGILYAYNTAT